MLVPLILLNFSFYFFFSPCFCGGFLYTNIIMKIIELQQLNHDCKKLLEICQDVCPFLHSIFNTQYLTGARFSDVYYLHKWYLKNESTLVLKPCKNNDIRIFNTDEVDYLLYKQVKDDFNVYNLTSYSTALHWFTRMYPTPNIMVKSKPIKTHVFRHLKAKTLKKQGATDIEIQKYLGEKNLYSAKTYIYSNIYQ